MKLKKTFVLTNERAAKMRTLAEYYAQQEHKSVDTAATLNQLIDYAHQLIQDEKRAALVRKRGA